jgi:hypothetical protein
MHVKFEILDDVKHRKCCWRLFAGDLSGAHAGLGNDHHGSNGT